MDHRHKRFYNLPWIVVLVNVSTINGAFCPLLQQGRCLFQNGLQIFFAATAHQHRTTRRFHNPMKIFGVIGWVSLDNISAITTQVRNGDIDIYVASSSETGITKLTYDTGPAGSTQTATDTGQTLTGAAGRDVLIGGAGDDRLIGGAGMDVIRDGMVNPEPGAAYGARYATSHKVCDVPIGALAQAVPDELPRVHRVSVPRIGGVADKFGTPVRPGKPVP